MRLLPVAAGGTARTVGKGGLELTVPEWEQEKKGEEGSGGGGGGGGGGGKASQTNSDSSKTTRTVRVPEGVNCWVPFYVLHRSKHVWGDDAEEFVPERFLDPAAQFAATASSEGGGDEGANEAPRRFLPFSLGARDCVGQALARTALVAELATLLGRFSFAVDRERMGGSLLEEGLGSTVIAGEAMAVTLRVLGGVWLLATPRGAVVGGGGERES